MDKVLYFPFISIPNTPWLMRTILYWEKVASIVPFEYVDNPTLLSKHMQELVREELVEQIFPAQHIGQVPKFDQAFLTFIDTQNKRCPTFNSVEKGHGMKYVPIHMEKLNGIGDELVERGLAWKGKGFWYLVESYTGKSFMSYLAMVLGTVIDYRPITDKYEHVASLDSDSKILDHKNSRIIAREKLRTKVLDDILPIPMFVEDLYDVLRFKEKYAQELMRFRNHIEGFLLELELMADEQVEDRILIFKREANEQIQEIKARMNEHKWQILSFVSLCSITSAVIPIVKAINTNSYVAAFEAAPGILGALGAALSKEQLNSVKGHPLAYAAIAESLPIYDYSLTEI